MCRNLILSVYTSELNLVLPRVREWRGADRFSASLSRASGLGKLTRRGGGEEVVEWPRRRRPPWARSRSPSWSRPSTSSTSTAVAPSTLASWATPWGPWAWTPPRRSFLTSSTKYSYFNVCRVVYTCFDFSTTLMARARLSSRSSATWWQTRWTARTTRTWSGWPSESLTRTARAPSAQKLLNTWWLT